MKITVSKEKLENKERLIESFMEADGYIKGTTRGEARGSVSDLLTAFLAYCEGRGELLARIFEGPTLTAQGFDLKIGSDGKTFHFHMAPGSTLKIEKGAGG